GPVRTSARRRPPPHGALEDLRSQERRDPSEARRIRVYHVGSHRAARSDNRKIVPYSSLVGGLHESETCLGK
ncbi:hypothetical protein V3C99_015732, partial [Haemonchus contortus]